MKLKKCAKDLQLFEDVTVQKVLSNMIANGVVVYRKEVWWSSKWGVVVLVVSVPASRPPVPGSNLGPGPPRSVIWGAEDCTVKTVQIKE